MGFNDRETELLDVHIPFHTASVRHKHKSTVTWINDSVSKPQCVWAG